MAHIYHHSQIDAAQLVRTRVSYSAQTATYSVEFAGGRDAVTVEGLEVEELRHLARQLAAELGMALADPLTVAEPSEQV